MRTRELVTKQQTYLEAVSRIGTELAARGYHYRRGTDGTDPRAPIILTYTPLARMNAFQALLYRETTAHGIGAIPVNELDRLPQLPWPGATVCHLHWVRTVLADVTSDDHADERIAWFGDLLAGLKAHGRKIVWTAHNVLPHDAPLPEKEVEVRKALVDAADAIHVMTHETAAACSEYFTLPMERTFYAPHPSYEGSYPDFVTRDAARHEMGIGPDDLVFLLFGALQRYKGVDELTDAFDRLSAEADRPVKLIIAGSPSDDELGDELRLWALGREDVVAEIYRVPNEDVQFLYRAADVSVLPYRRMLNSGSALLSMTFGVPVIAPAFGGFRELAHTFGGITYEPDAPDALYGALRQALTRDLEADRARIAAHIGSIAPSEVSREFVAGLLDTLGWAQRVRGETRWGGRASELAMADE